MKNILKGKIFAFARSLASSYFNSILVIDIWISMHFETYKDVCLRADAADCQELALMCLEVERNMFWKRKQGEKKYLLVCEKVKVEEENDKVIGKMKEVMRDLKEIKEGVREFNSVRGEIETLNKLNLEVIEKLENKTRGK